MSKEIIADLAYISAYVLEVRKQLMNNQKPEMDYLNQMRDLAEKVQRQFDPQFDKWVNEQAPS